MKNLDDSLTRRKIIKGILRLFVKNGYHGTSIADISKTTKITKGGIYFHFKSKHALLKRILREYDEAFLDKIIKDVKSSEGKAVDKMNVFLKSSINFAAQNQNLILCLTSVATELHSSGKEYEREVMRIYKKFYKFISDILEEGKQDGSFRPDIDPPIVAINLIGTNEGNFVQWKINKNKLRGELFSRSFIKFFLNGICREKRE